MAASAAAPEDDIIVSVTRLEGDERKIGSALTIIDRPEIEAAQAVTIVDLLSATPGISFTRNGGVGTATSVRIRGAEADQTVVVVDGVKVNDPSTSGGGYNFATLLTGDLSRVEILRGPQSILWGSQAIGGVINLVSAMPERPLEMMLDLEAGAYDSIYGRAAIGGAGEKLSWRLSASTFSTGGYSAFSRKAGGLEADGARNQAASARIAYAVADNVSVDLRASYAHSEADFDATSRDSQDFSTTNELQTYAGVNFSLLDGRLKNRVAFSYTDIERDQFNPERVVQRTLDARGKNRRVEYQGDLTLSSLLTVVFGAEHERASINTASPTVSVPNPIAVRGNDTTNSLYTLLRITPVDSLNLTGGVRYVDHETFGNRTLFGAGLSWSPDDGRTHLRASYGEGFKAPTPYQLHTIYGNASLKPETAKGFDAGIDYTSIDGRISVSATYFQRKTSNLINFTMCSSSVVDPLCSVNSVSRMGYYANIDRTKAHGVELGLALRPIENVELTANYTLADTRNRSAGNNYDNWLDRRPRQMFNASASYVWPFALKTAVAVRHSGRSYNDLAGKVPLARYTLVDLRASLPVATGLEVFGRIENLFDEHYELIRNYGTAGRSAYAGIRARF